MKANLSEREPIFLTHWQTIGLYKKLRAQSQSRPKFILHDGPPYANGNIHLGHAFNKILKDVTLKTRQMLGFDAPFVMGWDCHGLPIEWKIEEAYRAQNKNKDAVDILEFRKECREFANKWLHIQREEFDRLGVFGDPDSIYATMDFSAEANIVENLGHFLLKGMLYRGLRPVMWSVVEKTALAEAEIEYKDHTSDAVFVAFPVCSTPVKELEETHMVIWTTTPWTLPGNRAIAYGADFTYVVIELLEEIPFLKARRLVVAQDLCEPFLKTLNVTAYKILATLPGSLLEGTVCDHPLAHHPALPQDDSQGYNFPVPLLEGEHVTTDAGTGLVHTAPGHGEEDFLLGKKNDLEIPRTVQGDGTYYDHVPLFKGLHVFKANGPVMEALKTQGLLVHHAKIIHSYPHSWRSKAPLIFRTTPQWFVDMSKIREKAVEEIHRVRWFPSQGQKRILSMVETRPDWCISRQRAWGTPITLFVHRETGEVLKDAKVHQRIVDVIGQEGGDAWFSSPPSRFLEPDYPAHEYEKITEILDVWFDAGSTHSFVLKNREDLAWPADLYLEGSDQHRGWFQSSLLVSVATTGSAPYHQVLTHGFLLDETGHKMSKSLGNGLTPKEIMQSHGADLLRLWTVSADVSEDIRFGKEILKQVEDTYRRFRNTLRYLLGALPVGAAANDLPKNVKELPELEQWVLHRLTELNHLLHTCSEKFDYLTFYNHLHSFCSQDLSAFYFDIRKDRLYCDNPNQDARKATLFVMETLFSYLTKWLAPVLSFTCEEAYLARHGDFAKAPCESIHLELFPTPPEEWQNKALAERWEHLRNIRRVVTGALEIERAAKTIGSSLQGNVTVFVTPPFAAYLEGVDLAELCITSKAEIILEKSDHENCPQECEGGHEIPDVPGIRVKVYPAKGQKCVRCWKILEEVKGPEGGELCQRCESVVQEGELL